MKSIKKINKKQSRRSEKKKSKQSKLKNIHNLLGGKFTQDDIDYEEIKLKISRNHDYIINDEDILKTYHHFDDMGMTLNNKKLIEVLTKSIQRGDLY